jgi:hypothetical protein
LPTSGLLNKLRPEAGKRVYHNDTWAWDGQAWTQVADTGPSPRSEHVMTFDNVRQRALLFGGLTWSNRKEKALAAAKKRIDLLMSELSG